MEERQRTVVIMVTSKHHVGRLTEDSVIAMLKRSGQLFVSGLTCYDCGSPFVVGTLDIQDYPVATGHTIADVGALTTVVQSMRSRPTREAQHLRNHRG